MNSPIVFFKYLLVLTSLLFMVACQPGYSVDQTEYYAREIGVINQFTISRWHNRTILPRSTFTVVSEDIERVDSVVLSTVVADAFSYSFEQVNGGYSDNSQVSALAFSKKQHSDYLLYIRVNEFNVLLDTEKTEPVTSYNRMDLTLTLVDVNSGSTIDKIRLSANTPFYALLGNDIKKLLTKPVRAIAQDLTGK